MWGVGCGVWGVGCGVWGVRVSVGWWVCVCVCGLVCVWVCVGVGVGIWGAGGLVQERVRVLHVVWTEVGVSINQLL